jgi:flagellar basal-body rod protein FlgF/flagellar basal-body rod protein FlgG
MLERIRNSAAAMTAIIRRQEITANNLANVNTAGYRKDRLFEEILDDAIDVDLFPTSQRKLSTWTDNTHGNYEFSDRPLDATIGGNGFFAVEDAQTGRTLYTRAGRFALNTEGTLVDSSGRQVVGRDGPIVVPPGSESIAIAPSGDVKAGQQVLGTISVMEFDEGVELLRVDGASFDARGAKPIEVVDPKIKSGYFEQSNVNALTEMTSMLQDSRMFESQQRAMRTLDQTLERAIRDLGQY